MDYFCAYHLNAPAKAGLVQPQGFFFFTRGNKSAPCVSTQTSPSQVLRCRTANPSPSSLQEGTTTSLGSPMSRPGQAPAPVFSVLERNVTS
ncbi:unnamed protein product [Gadus morhua 'NCC']